MKTGEEIRKKVFALEKTLTDAERADVEKLTPEKDLSKSTFKPW